MAYGTALWVLQQAVVAKLLADATFTALLGQTAGLVGVFDEVPENATFPYVVVNDQGTEQNDDTFDGQSVQGTFTIDIWSRELGWQESLTILDRLNALLHRTTQATLPLPGGVWSLIGLRFDNSLQARDPDGLSRHVQVRYMYWAEEL